MQDSNVKTLSETALKKSRKKSKASTLARSNKRGKKKKKKQSVFVVTSGGVDSTSGSNNNINNNNSVGVNSDNFHNGNNSNGSSCSSNNDRNSDTNFNVILEQRNVGDIVSSSSSVTTELLSGTTGNLIQSIATGMSNASTANIMLGGMNDSIERQHNDLLSSSSVTSSSVSSTSSSCIPISQVEIQVQLEGEIYFCLVYFVLFIG